MKVCVQYSTIVNKDIEIDDKFLVLAKEDEADLLSYEAFRELEKEMFFAVAEKVDGNVLYIYDTETEEVLYEG